MAKTISLINLKGLPSSIKFYSHNCGSKDKPLYKYEFDPKYGCPRRVLSGKMDLQAYIQQSKDDIDFKNIGKMLVDSKNNVIDHFKAQGEEFDQTALPRNIHEYQALHNKMQEKYADLPKELKESFGDSFDTFFQSYRNGSYKTVIKNYYSAKAAAEAEAAAKAAAAKVEQEGGSK